MRIKFSFLIAAFAGVLLFAISCKKDEHINKIVEHPTFAEFAGADTVRSYYINSANTPIKIPIGFTTVSNVDRKINISVTSRATAGVQYQALPTVVTIPAGQAIDSLVLTGLFAGYTGSRKDTLIINITGGDAPANAYRNRQVVYMQRYCDVVPSALLGDYTTSFDQQAGYGATGNYTAKIVSITPTGAKTATAVIYNFADKMLGDPYVAGDLAINPGITVYLDWNDPANFKITLPASQAPSVAYYGTAGVIKPASASGTYSGAGTFSSCDQTFTIYYNFTVGSTNYGNFRTVLRR